MKHLILLMLFCCSLIYGQSPSPNKIYNIHVKSASGKILDLKDGNKNNGAKIVPEKIASSKAAKFYIKNAGSGYYYIYNATSKKVIDANKTTSSVSQWSYHGGDNQKWKLVPKSGGYYCIQNKKTGKYLDLSSKGSLIQYGFHGGNNQQFKFQTASTVNTPVVNNTITKSPKNIFFPSNYNLKVRNGLVAYTNNDSWNSKKHFRTVSDFNGDGHMDLVGFGNHTVYVSYGNSKMEFAAAKTIFTTEFTNKQGWTEANERFVVDLNGDNRVDLAGFHKFGLAVSYQLPDGTLQKRDIAKGSEAFGNGNGWSAKKHVRTLADVNNDGYMDIIGFGDPNTYIALGTKYGTFGKGIAFHGFCTKCSSGWDTIKHERLVADVNNDGKKDLVGFGDNAVYAAYGNGDGTFQKGRNILNDFSAKQGYNTTVHERQVGDINADGKQDLIAFGDHKIYVALGKGNGVFSKAEPATGEMSKAKGWRSDKHNRHAIDMNNDNKVDFVGFGDKGVTIAFSKSSSSNLNYHIVSPRALFSPENWMSVIKDNINLKDLTIPGTHDSGADYGCPDYSYSKYGKCQDMTISQQLEAGVRYLDIRLKYNKNEDKLRIQHGKCYQEDHFGKVLSDIKNFFTKNPKEAIIMRIKDEDDDTDAAIFTNRFNQYIRNYSNIIYNGTDIPNLGTARGKIIIVDFSYKFNAYHPHGSQITPKGEWYYDGENKDDRWSLNWEQMVNCNSSNEPRSKLWFSAFNQNGLNWDVDDVNSFFESATNVIGGALTTTATPRDISEYMIPKLEQGLNKPEYKKGTFGMVVLDFPSKKLIRQLIETNNIPSKIKY